ncbi:hypothetical protein QBC38DRAFT_442446 [Podospora fimiseda]|uniref:Heterokaryon incompatibility domain-containing protein n=1 Tax=Podospora fimiseda TaxID=252190 RepID=A0AAN7H1R9_9PEZI|nr:hypothetical protein QBC38DRAFT_442446 [Podospora fimiseda]
MESTTSAIRVLSCPPSDSTIIQAKTESINLSSSKEKYDVLIPFYCVRDFTVEKDKTATTTAVIFDGTDESVEISQQLADAVRNGGFKDRLLWVWGVCNIKDEMKNVERVFEKARRIYCYGYYGCADGGGKVHLLVALAGMLAKKQTVVVLGADGSRATNKRFLEGFRQEKKVIERLRKESSSNKKKGLGGLTLEILDLLRVFKCEDERDRLYLTAAAAAGVECEGETDRRRSVEEVYLFWTKKEIRKTGELDIMNWVRPPSLESDWPSWVPRFMNKIDKQACPLLKDGRVYKAGKMMNAVLRDSDSEAGGEKEIILSGIRFDEVEMIGNSWDPVTDPLFKTAEEWKELTMKELGEFIECPYGGLEGRRKALQKLLVAAAGSREKKLGWTLSKPLPSNPAAHNACAHRRLFVTKRGFIGLGPAFAEKGDVVAVLYGGKTPYLLRRLLTSKTEAEFGSQKVVYRLVGEVYVAGIMEGQAMQWENAVASMREFRIC